MLYCTPVYLMSPTIAYGTLTVDAIGMALAGFGFLSSDVYEKTKRRASEFRLSPLLAAFIHVTSELTFILNSARLLPVRQPSQSEGMEQHPTAVARVQTA